LELPGESAFAALTDEEMLGKWADIMDELQRRDVTRSANSPVADWAEQLVSRRLGLKLVKQAMAGYDALDGADLRVQIKGRRITKRKRSMQLGTMRGLDKGGFDYLVAVVFGERMELRQMWKLPIELVREHARFQEHVNGHRLMLQGALLRDPRAVDLLKNERLAA
jgi:hypothetical protein